jgi:hypothetical protein
MRRADLNNSGELLLTDLDSPLLVPSNPGFHRHAVPGYDFIIPASYSDI